jgi:hypothetical protein
MSEHIGQVLRVYITDSEGYNLGYQSGGGIEYLHHIPASRKRQRKGTQCPGV